MVVSTRLYQVFTTSAARDIAAAKTVSGNMKRKIIGKCPVDEVVQDGVMENEGGRLRGDPNVWMDYERRRDNRQGAGKNRKSGAWNGEKIVP